jgi:peptidoglycan/LPS O-acetylase OafA/YrhL
MSDFQKTKVTRIAAALVVAGLLAVPAIARAADAQQAKQDAGVGLAAAMANLFYIPAKITYAALGGLTGGLTYALTLGSTEAAERVWVASGGGDYVLSTEHVSGQKRVRFTGSQAPAQPEF